MWHGEVRLAGSDLKPLCAHCVVKLHKFVSGASEEKM